MDNFTKLHQLWQQLYASKHEEQFRRLTDELTAIKRRHFAEARPIDTLWYKDAIVYSTYADLFHRDINGLREKLPYLQALGVTCLWLLPILESPMKDAGFDISNYEQIRANLLGLPDTASTEERDRVFADFLNDAHARGIRLIFDIAINHSSTEHPWFQEARQSKDSPKRDFYIWSDSPERFQQARLLMKGMEDCNWEWDEAAGQYYFHRFFRIQPDLNYHSPELLIEMTKMLIRWKIKGVDGIRADAVPFLWKEDGTTCESLPQVHVIMKFFRAALDYLEPGTLILAEACQPPKDVVAYFSAGDECHAAYHFPVMPRIYGAMAEEQAAPVEMVMNPAVTPAIPDECQWFMFLRCHDELSLEMVTPEEREFIFNYYTKDPRWNYRKGEGISARLANLFGHDIRKIRLAYSIMFTLPGTPIIYYGDEAAKSNDEAFYQEMFAHSGYPDSRYFARGRIDWAQVERDLNNPDSLAAQVYQALTTMIAARKTSPAFSRGSLEFVAFADESGARNPHILAYYRKYAGETRLILHNLSAREQRVSLPESVKPVDMLGQSAAMQGKQLILPPYGVYWL